MSKPKKPKKITALATIPKKAKEERPRPRTAALPGFEDKTLEDIRDSALSYVDARDRRQAATVIEVERKKKLLDLMHKHKLTIYRDAEANLIVEVVVTEEKVKVRVGAGDDEKEEE